MRKRAEQVDQTRQRIVEAAVRLHTTVGPANTTVSALAEEAGVTRLTVYRHFPDEDTLFAACSAHWATCNPSPDAERWRAIPNLEERARQALDELYRWYDERGEELFLLYRDPDFVPESVRQRVRDEATAMVDALVAGSGARGGARRRLRAAAGHALSFWTWRSLVVEQGLDTDEAVDLAASLFTGAMPAER
jgi:AcrR family transcriptional regulator